MSWLLLGTVAVIAILLVLVIIKNRKISERDAENELLASENSSLQLKVSTLELDIQKLKEAKKEISEIEKKKTTRKKQEKKEAPETGDVQSRLDRLNDGVQSD